MRVSPVPRRHVAEVAAHVTVLILDELLSVAMEFVQESARLLSRAVLEDALKDAATVRVSREAVNFSDTGVGDEEEVFSGNSFESALQRCIIFS